MAKTMAEQFACAHCGKRYPRLATLVNRKVRCQGCRQPFILRADGTVEAIGATAERPEPAAVEQPERVAAATASAEKDTLRQLTRTWSENATGTIAKRRRRSSSEGIPEEHPITNRLDALRKAASTSLKEAAERAAEVIEPTTTEQSAKARMRQSSIGEPLDRHLIARLSGSGEQQARHRRSLVVVGLIVVVVPLLFLFVGGESDPRAAALSAYAADRTPGSEHAWLNTIDGQQRLLRLASIEAVDFEPARTLDLTSVQTVIERELAGMVANDAMALFADRAHERELLVAENSPLTRQEFIAELRANGVRLVTFEDVLSQLRASDADPDTVIMVSYLLAGTSGPGDARHWRELLLDGDLPDFCEVSNVSGRGGQRLQFEGRVPRLEPLSAWGGIIMRCNGDEWAGPWRVLTCFERSNDVSLENPLMTVVKRAQARVSASSFR